MPEHLLHATHVQDNPKAHLVYPSPTLCHCATGVSGWGEGETGIGHAWKGAGIRGSLSTESYPSTQA